ncbi:hypothetical protein JWR93_06985 [Lactiplantibacillus plantarum]|nr:hypothetical protein JWR93_06985 [Lactiplantibacillus plantarum]
MYKQIVFDRAGLRFESDTIFIHISVIGRTWLVSQSSKLISGTVLAIGYEQNGASLTV